MNIRLRALEPEDLEILYQIENDQALWQAGATNVPYSRYVLHDYIANTSSDIYADRQLRLMIEDSDEGLVVGIVDLVNFDPRHLRAEIGLVIRPNCRKQGYGKAVVAELCRYATEILHLHQLYVIIAEKNAAALQLFDKFGFSRSAVLQDWLCEGRDYDDAVLMQKIF